MSRSTDENEPKAPLGNDAKPTYAAANGLLHRRHFLHGGFVGAAIAAASQLPTSARAAAEPWRYTPGQAFSNYGQPSAHEKAVIRWISATDGAPTNGISWCPLQDLDGMITPNGLHYERHHNGVPAIDPATHKFVIHGLVDRALKFSVESLLRYPRESRICVIECGGNSNAGWRRKPVQTAVGYFHGLVSCSEWSGVPLRLLLAEAGLQPGATWAVAEGADAFGMTVSVPVEKLLDDAMIALYQNGERIRPEQGYPMRLLVPGYEGVLNVKWLRTLMLSDKPVMARNETSRYTELQKSGKARMFTHKMGVKSVITSPSGGMQLDGPNDYEISGLAWSGAGCITRVDISADGGVTWVEAALNEPVLPRAFTRFRAPWRWDGRALVLQSRAHDDTGALQPTRAELIAERGKNGYFHYNAIVSWAVNEDGFLSHTYVDAAANESDKDDPFEQDWDF